VSTSMCACTSRVHPRASRGVRLADGPAGTGSGLSNDMVIGFPAVHPRACRGAAPGVSPPADAAGVQPCSRGELRSWLRASGGCGGCTPVTGEQPAGWPSMNFWCGRTLRWHGPRGRRAGTGDQTWSIPVCREARGRLRPLYRIPGGSPTRAGSWLTWGNRSTASPVDLHACGAVFGPRQPIAVQPRACGDAGHAPIGGVEYAGVSPARFRGAGWRPQGAGLSATVQPPLLPGGRRSWLTGPRC